MRAEKLRQRLVESKLSKYNLGADFSLPAEAKDKKVILVPGQVEDDASIKTGTVSIKSNLELLRTVRERNPHAYIVYKPHPDVLVGNRKGDIPAELIAELADYQALDADIIQCIQRADEVHTMTSLSGFEALLHGKQVHCYGLPFYAGWGLTVDEHHCPRRGKINVSRFDLSGVDCLSNLYPPNTATTYYGRRSCGIFNQDAAQADVYYPKKAGRVIRYYRKLIMFCKVRFG